MRLKQSDAPPILTPEKKYQLEEEVKDDIPRGPPLKLSNDSIQGPNPGIQMYKGYQFQTRVSSNPIITIMILIVEPVQVFNKLIL